MDELNLQGVWWDPSSPDLTVGGTLTFTNTAGAVLELLGSLSDENSLTSASVFKPRFVHGISTSGKQITLYRCVETNRSFNSGSGLSTTRLAATFLFVGDHFAADTDLSFVRFAMKFDQFSNWAAVSGFQMTIEQDPATNSMKRLEVGYEFPDPNAIIVNDLELRLSPTLKQNADLISKYTLEQEMFWEARASSARQLESWLDDFYHLRNFISLGVGRPVYPVSIRATVSVEIPQGSKLERTHDVEVYYTTHNEYELEKLVDPSRMLFTLANIHPFYQEALTLWFQKADVLRPVYDLYFSTLYNPKLYLEGRFLSLAQALETYHRRMVGGTYLTETEYADLNAAFLSALDSFKIDADAKNAFRGKLQYLNEFSLRKRVRDVINSLGGGTLEFIPDPGRFASRIVDTRNYLTHYNPSLKANAAEGETLFHLTELLRFLLELCLLRELGLPEELRAQIVADHQGYHWLRRRQAPI
jgi:hypothetical protein